MNWPKAILFDLDGTLADSAPDIADALNSLLGEQRLAEFTIEEVTSMVGGGVPLLIERALKAHGEVAVPERIAALVPRFLDIYTPRAAEKTRLYPDVREVLESLHRDGVALGVVTNKPEAVTRMILDALGVARLFGAIIGGDTLSQKKPDPAPVFAALETLECAPAQSLFVGDSRADSQAARAAGVAILLVTFGYTRTPVDELDSDGLVEAFSALPNAIKILRNSPARS